MFTIRDIINSWINDDPTLKTRFSIHIGEGETYTWIVTSNGRNVAFARDSKLHYMNPNKPFPLYAEQVGADWIEVDVGDPAAQDNFRKYLLWVARGGN